MNISINNIVNLQKERENLDKRFRDDLDSLRQQLGTYFADSQFVEQPTAGWIQRPNELGGGTIEFISKVDRKRVVRIDILPNLIKTVNFYREDDHGQLKPALDILTGGKFTIDMSSRTTIYGGVLLAISEFCEKGEILLASESR